MMSHRDGCGAVTWRRRSAAGGAARAGGAGGVRGAAAGGPAGPAFAGAQLNSRRATPMPRS